MRCSRARIGSTRRNRTRRRSDRARRRLSRPQGHGDRSREAHRPRPALRPHRLHHRRPARRSRRVRWPRPPHRPHPPRPRRPVRPESVRSGAALTRPATWDPRGRQLRPTFPFSSGLRLPRRKPGSGRTCSRRNSTSRCASRSRMVCIESARASSRVSPRRWPCSDDRWDADWSTRRWCRSRQARRVPSIDRHPDRGGTASAEGVRCP